MGAGIAQWLQRARANSAIEGHQAGVRRDRIKRIADAYHEGVKRRKFSELDAQHGFARVHPTTEYTGFGDCDLVIEAVLEKIEVKRLAL